jgi:enoyl-CoA hydratase/carnithine racemase
VKSEEGNAVFDSIGNLSKPVITMIEGVALDDGCESAMVCGL